MLSLVASFAEYRSEFVSDPPDLVFPLESLRAFGRPISILLLVVLMSFITWFNLGTKRIQDHLGIRKSLLMIQILVFAKNLYYGNTLEAVLAFFTFFLVYYLFHAGVSKWITSDKIYQYGVICFVGVITLFNFMGTYQSLFDFYPMIFQQNRYMGMTGNPQHAAVLLASGVPLFMFLLIDQRSMNVRLILFALLIVTIYFLILSGSRTGLLEAGLGLAVFLVGYRASSIKWIVFLGVIILFIQSYTSFQVSDDINQNVENYAVRGNTRAQVLLRQIRAFSEYPVFGAPLKGNRLAFEENSYGAIAASLGLIGLLPLIFLLRGLMKMMGRLWKRSQQVKEGKHYYLLVVSGIFSLIVGAFLEAYLLGNLTWPLIMLFTYLAWGYYLLQKIDQSNANIKEHILEKDAAMTNSIT